MNLEGKYLYPSCAGETFCRIDKQYVDENECPVLDITINNLNTIFHFQSPELENYEAAEFKSCLTEIIVPEGMKFKIIKVGYNIKETSDPNFVIVNLNMPEGGCYRCSQSFILKNHEKN